MTRPLTPALENAIRRRTELARAESRGMPITTDENDREVLLTEVDRLRAARTKDREAASSALGKVIDDAVTLTDEQDERRTEADRLRSQVAEVARFAAEWEANAEAIILAEERTPKEEGIAYALSVCALAVRTGLDGGVQ